MAQQPSNLWPNGDNKELIIAVAHYLNDLLKDNSSKLDEVSVDSLQIATESLQTMIDPDSDNLPPSPFKLTALYSAYKNKQSSPSKSEESKENKSSSINTKKNIDNKQNLSKQRKKFLEFLQVLKKHDFFKNIDEGSDAYQQRMEKARNQYNSRFPNMRIDSLEWITQNNEISEEDKKMAESLKQAGNALLGQKKYKEAIEKYSEAISYNDQNAVYYSNRAAAYTYLRKYNEAISDAQNASLIDENYVKAYVREGLAHYELKDYESAHAAYSKALNKTKSTDKNWESYMEKVEMCQMKMDEENQPNNANNDNGNPQMPDFSQLGNLLGGLGGGGAGGMDFGKIMQNPMMQQMAQQMMKDPNAMKNMTDMLGSMGGGGMNMPNMGNANDNDNDSGGVNTGQIMADLMQNPEKAKRIFKEAMQDGEVKQMLADDPSLGPLIERIKSGDYAAFMELGSKPNAMKQIKSLIAKYYK